MWMNVLLVMEVAVIRVSTVKVPTNVNAQQDSVSQRTTELARVSGIPYHSCLTIRYTIRYKVEKIDPPSPCHAAVTVK